MKTLVVYYTRTKNTELVAAVIAKEFNADLRRVEDLKTYGILRALTLGSFDALRGKKGKIKLVNFDLSGYDRVFIGTPIWAWRAVPAINTFIFNADFTGKEVVPFVTMGGGNPGKSLSKMTELIEAKGGKVIGSFSIRTGGKKSGEIAAETAEKIAEFKY